MSATARPDEPIAGAGVRVARAPERTVPEALERARTAMLRDPAADARAVSRIGADAVLEELILHGCTVVFGYPGGVLLPIYDVLGRHPQVRHVLVRHEQDAVHAADGYARAAGSVGVCLGTSGPGATNLVTGVATAWRSQTPILVLTGNVVSGLLGRDAFQEIDITGITLPITKSNELVRPGDDLRSAMRSAMRIAVADPPGPTHVDITKDAFEAEVGPPPASIEPVPPRYLSGHEPDVGDGETRDGRRAAGTLDARLVAQLACVAGGDPVAVDGGLQAGLPRLRAAGARAWGPGPFDTPGYAIPAALGASLAVGGPSWAVTDAIGFQRSCRELVTISHEAAPVRILHLADRRDADMAVPDAMGIAAACGVHGVRVRNRRELQPALELAAGSERGVLVSLELG